MSTAGDVRLSPPGVEAHVLELPDGALEAWRALVEEARDAFTRRRVECSEWSAVGCRSPFSPHFPWHMRPYAPSPASLARASPAMPALSMRWVSSGESGARHSRVLLSAMAGTLFCAAHRLASCIACGNTWSAGSTADQRPAMGLACGEKVSPVMASSSASVGEAFREKQRILSA